MSNFLVGLVKFFEQKVLRIDLVKLKFLFFMLKRKFYGEVSTA